MKARALVCAAVVIFAGCGGGGSSPASPVGPTPPVNPVPPVPVLRFQPGPFLLSVQGFDIVNDSTLLPCTPFAKPSTGKHVSVYGVLREQPDGYVFTDNATGGFTLTFSVAAGIPATVKGHGRGQVRDEATPITPAKDVRLALADGGSGSATLDGTAQSSDGGAMVGRLSGVATFSNSIGEVATCPTVTAFLRPGAP